ncbi:hypothetical protein BCR39DRAFT_103712 [Naematelia encephala]|uniref:Uncharacterized protein n=1 Tax=Naematelia encephala TaxID=71784 RepID=A0A1Y2B877_9TREE|nr:hypothetical protein BCR39DRAFT_103712 [Naematelia encephala]
MPNTASSLFDSNYSLSSPSSPIASRCSPNSSYSRSPHPQSPLRGKPLVITFPHPDLPSGRSTPPLVSPTTVSPTTIPDLSDLDDGDPLKSVVVPVLKRDDAYGVAPESAGVEEGTQQSYKVDEDMCPELNKMAKDFELLNMRRQSSTQIMGQYDSYESCMRGKLSTAR